MVGVGWLVLSALVGGVDGRGAGVDIREVGEELVTKLDYIVLAIVIAFTALVVTAAIFRQ